MNVSLKGKDAQVVASENVQSYSGDKVDLGVEADLFGPAAFVSNFAIER
jgi:hypothetical protein